MIQVNKGSDFEIGIEMPSMLKYNEAIINGIRDVGITYINYYVNTSIEEKGGKDLPVTEVNHTMLQLANELGLNYSISCHIYDVPDECIVDAIKNSKDDDRFKGVLIDEIEHVRLLYLKLFGDKMSALGFTENMDDLKEAYKCAVDGYKKLREKYLEKGCANLTATHIWPVMHHISARAGYTVCPKICKELYSSVSLAIGMGAAKQYNRPLWADIDLWCFNLIPGHSIDEFKSNLMLAYWMGVDLAYVEGCGYNLQPSGNQGTPFSLLNQITDKIYQLTPHGEVLKWFCKDYLPSHPRSWSFRDVKPSIAIIRFEDTCFGQSYFPGPADLLYGSEKMRSDRDTEAWLDIWNLLTFGKTGRDGITHFKYPFQHYDGQDEYDQKKAFSCYSHPHLSELHSFFTPLNGVVVYDHLVEYEMIQGIPLLFITGKEISADSFEAVHRCVMEGAICVAWGPLMKKHGFDYWHSGIEVITLGKGKFIITDEFQCSGVFAEVKDLIGRPDEIRYRFSDNVVVLKRVTDNSVSVDIL